MSHVTSLPRLSRNVYAYGRAVLGFPRAREFRRELARAVNERFDLVHFNHEGLFLLAHWLRRRVRVPFTMHIRTNLVDTMFSRWQTRLIARTMDHLVFITENEERNFERLRGRPRAARVIYNVATPCDGGVSPHPGVPIDDRFKVACLGNYAWIRGLDRLVNVAEAMRRQGRDDVLFVVAGDMHLPRSLPGDLGVVARAGGSLVDYAKRKRVDHMFRFLGHVAEPERVLAACDVLVRPGRGNNPWGRDVLEALAAGRPVIALGTYDRFVEDGVTGILRAEFEAGDFGRAILDLADDRASCARLGAAGRERILDLCNGPARAADLLAVWHTAVRA